MTKDNTVSHHINLMSNIITLKKQIIMKNKTGVWIDSSKAIIVELSGDKENITEIESVRIVS